MLKNTAIPAKAGISLFTLIFRLNHPSHSCEGRNLRAERRKLSPKAYKRTITRRFAAAEIPAFAGMRRGERRELRGGAEIRRAAANSAAGGGNSGGGAKKNVKKVYFSGDSVL
ncbi:MAG: hypothetical protein ACR2QC_10445 [Gammaproteobacteria bacterium]